MLKKNKLTSGIFFALVAILPASFAFAQDFGTTAVNNGLGGVLGAEDPRILVGRIIQIVLSLLGIIILGLIIYAGFLWMTSNGEEDKITQAKRIITNAIIGLVITLSAWAITTFVISRLFGAISGTIVNNPQVPGYNNITNSGFGAIGSCSVESVYPVNNQRDVARNSAVMVTFKEEIGLDSTCINASKNACACNNTASCSLINPQAIRIFKSDLGDACLAGSCPESNKNSNITEAYVSVSPDKKTLVLSFPGLLGSQNSNTKYGVKITSDLKKVDGLAMFATCSSPDLQWGFEVSTKLDLTPPQVVSGSLFPRPDNDKDTTGVSIVAKKAIAMIAVPSCPKTYSPATVVKITPDTSTPAAEVVMNYHGLINKFKVIVSSDKNKAQIFNGNTNALLGIADFDNDNKVTFSNYLSLKTTSHKVGDSWVIDIKPEVLADTLTVGNEIYTFAKTNENNNILVSEGECNNNIQAANIRAKLSGHPDINVELNQNRIALTAKIAGSRGNSLVLSSTSDLILLLFEGGVDGETANTINGKKDNPMNSIIKIGFNEAINPLTLSGTATELAGYIRIINASSTSRTSGASCNMGADCLSYKCENSACVGDYLNGRFMVSGAYKTVEFISDNECGINGCGEKMYCLPPNSNLAVEFKAANLKICNDNQDCTALAPFRTCSAGALGYKTCQDQNNRNYPSANILSLDGVIDTALNSLDGNGDSVADGPISYFNNNYPNDKDKKDNYRFSFFINNKIESTPPKITAILPTNSQSDISLAVPVKIVFSTLMMSDTIRSGGKSVANGSSTIEHKFINLKSSEPSPLGFWVDSYSEEVEPLDGVSDITVATIEHSPFLQSITYNTQVGSGVKDIFQNCFKPSIGPGCEATVENPSCCFGVATSSLSDGNCN
ncbi:MAG: pilin [Patescibacteria group bacterium]